MRTTPTVGTSVKWGHMSFDPRYLLTFWVHNVPWSSQTVCLSPPHLSSLCSVLHHQTSSLLWLLEPQSRCFGSKSLSSRTSLSLLSLSVFVSFSSMSLVDSLRLIILSLFTVFHSHHILHPDGDCCHLSLVLVTAFEFILRCMIIRLIIGLHK